MPRSAATVRLALALSLGVGACGGQTTGSADSSGAGGVVGAAGSSTDGASRSGAGGLPGSGGTSMVEGSGGSPTESRPTTRAEASALCAEICSCAEPAINDNCSTVCYGFADTFWDCVTAMEFLVCWRDAVREVDPCTGDGFSRIVPACQEIIDAFPDQCDLDTAFPSGSVVRCDATTIARNATSCRAEAVGCSDGRTYRTECALVPGGVDCSCATGEVIPTFVNGTLDAVCTPELLTLCGYPPEL